MPDKHKNFDGFLVCILENDDVTCRPKISGVSVGMANPNQNKVERLPPCHTIEYSVGNAHFIKCKGELGKIAESQMAFFPSSPYI